MQMAEPAKATGSEALPHWEQAAEEAIAVCGGDARAAVMSLLFMNAALERELDETRMVASSGFTRGWHRNRIGKGAK
jgi:hypothetical protein